MNHLYLRETLHLAEERRGFCSPNPSVGALLVKNNQIIASGYHWACGEAHAEALVLKKAGKDAEGATLYVSLEPCCHTQKKTPPCTKLIIEHKIKKVVFGFKDPNPAVFEKSEKILKEAGITLVYLPLPEIKAFYESYSHWWKTKTPFVTAKLAMSLDGKISGKNGMPLSLTGNKAQEFTHLRRKKSDALLTTSITILKDNPQMNVRLAGEIYKKPIYILDTQLNFTLEAQILKTAAPITLFYGASQPIERLIPYQKANINCVNILEDAHGNLNLENIIDFIGQQGCHDLWIEAGGRSFQSFYEANLLNRAYLYVAPLWLGNAAQSAFDAPLTFEKPKKRWFSLENDAICELEW